MSTADQPLIITAKELESYPKTKSDSDIYGRLDCCQFTGSVVIEGDISGKFIEVTDGSLTVNGNVTDCNFEVMNTEIKRASAEMHAYFEKYIGGCPS